MSVMAKASSRRELECRSRRSHDGNDARRPGTAKRPAAKSRSQGWVRTRRDSKGGFSFLEINDGSCLGNIQVLADGPLPNYESEIKHLTRRLQRHASRAGQGLAGQGTGDRGRRPPSVIVHGWADPETYPLQKKQHSLRVPPHDRPPAAADQHLRRGRPGAQLRLPLDPRFLPGRRLPLRPHADHHGQRLRRGRRDVQGHHARPGQRRRDDEPTGRSTSAAISSTGPPISPSAGSWRREIFACALGKMYTFGPTFRAENSNTTRHLAEFWMVEPEMAFFELTDNMDLAERFLKRIFRDVLEQLPGGHGVLQPADRQHGDRDARGRSSPATSFGCPTPRRSRFWTKSGAEVRVPRRTGAATCRPSTSAI